MIIEGYLNSIVNKIDFSIHEQQYFMIKIGQLILKFLRFCLQAAFPMFKFKE